jgi:hypothetical protein
MDETMLSKMLNEIDSMTPEEYWKLFNESQKLPDSLLDWEPVPALALMDTVVMFNNISFSIEYKDHSEILGNSHYSELEDMVCLQAA